jgi:hypothetical protein
LRLSESAADDLSLEPRRDLIKQQRQHDLDFNTSFTRVLGYTREEGIGLPNPR